MSNVPRARGLVAEIAEEMEELGARMEELAQLLAAALADLHRRPPARKPAPRRAPPVGADMAAYLRKFARDNPDMSQTEIAHRFGINPGRVAEALHGDR